MLGLLLLLSLLLFANHAALTTNHAPTVRSLPMVCLTQPLTWRPSIPQLSGLQARSVYPTCNFALRLRLLRHSLIATFICVRRSCLRVNRLSALIQLTCLVTMGIFGWIHSFLFSVEMRDFFVLQGLSQRFVSCGIGGVLVRLRLSHGTFLFVKFAFRPAALALPR